MAILFINLKELLDSHNFVIYFKRLLNVIKECDTAWILCDSLHAVDSYGFPFTCMTMGQASDLMTELK